MNWWSRGKVFTYKYWSERIIFNNQPLCQDTLVELFSASPFSFVLIIFVYLYKYYKIFLFTIKYLLDSLCSIKLARSRGADTFWTNLRFLMWVIKTWDWIPGIKVKCGRCTLPPLCHSLAWLHLSLSVIFMVYFLTDKWKSNSQVMP